LSIKTLLVEDEPNAMERLKGLLEGHADVNVIGEAADGLQAVRMIDTLQPELVFLDIQIPGANGFEVLEKTTHKPMVIFMTAYDEFAVKAFEANAVDYVLKPSTTARVTEAVTRALDRRRSVDNQLLAALRTSLERAGAAGYLRRFAVSRADEILIIQESGIYCFRAEDKYVFLHTRNEEYFFDMTLKELESRLDPAVFCRIHKSYIVSLDKVRKIHRWFHGDLVVQLEDANKSKLKVGRSYRDELRRRLNL
jgi:DNA-binding LytR/AlgR family response regulator